MEKNLRRSIELVRHGFNPLPLYRQSLIQYELHDRIAATQATLEEVTGEDRILLVKDHFGKWRENSYAGVAEGARRFIEEHSHFHLRTYASMIVHMEVSLFNGIIPLSKRDRRLFNLTAVEETRLGDGTAVYDKDSRQWNFSQRKGVYYNPAYFMVMSI